MSSGAKYEGTWNNGLQDGYGTETYADGGKGGSRGVGGGCTASQPACDNTGYMLSAEGLTWSCPHQ